MKRSLSSILVSVGRLLLGLGAVLAFNAAVLAATPVDIYQSMESGNNGDVLTAAIMNASTHGTGGWSATSGTLWVATKYPRDLPGPVICGGVTYNGTGSTRTWKYNTNNYQNYASVSMSGSGYTYITIACYYTTETTVKNTYQYDTIAMFGNHTYCILQGTNDGNGPYIHSHTGQNGTAHFGPDITLTPGKTYWVNLHWDGNASTPTASVMAFDPANSFAQVGTTSATSSQTDVMTWSVMFGRQDNHGNNTPDTTQSYFGQICVDYTNAAFPLVPSGGSDQPPSAPANVRDGTGSDITYTTSNSQLSANWDASTDPDGSVTAYQYAIGTSAGGTQTVNWATLGNVTTVTKTGLSLTNGQTYYFSVKAVDNQGLAGNATNSNGQTVDTTAPGAPANVRDGTGADITYTSSTTQLSANWDAAVDAESGISGYQFAIGTTAGGTQTVNWTTLGNVTTVTKTGLTLSNGQTYFFSVQAINGAGLTGSATNSNGQKADSTAPSAPATVRDGTGADISTTSSNTQLSANWDASTDNESGISGYQYAIGTTAGGTQTVNWTLLGNVTTVTKTGLSLSNGQTYYFSVQAINGAGLTGSATNSNGQTVQTTDVTPPSAPPAVRDGTGADISTTSSTTQLSANWDASTDNESGISGYQYAIGTTAGGTQAVNWTSLGNVTTVTKTGLTLTVGQTYYFSVQAVNGAGLTGSATNSNGQTVVTSSSVIYFQDNFESWTVHGGVWSSVSGENSTQALNTSVDYAKAGAKSLKLTDNDSTSIGACLVKNFSPVISGNIYVRFFVYLPTGFTSANSGCASRRLLRVWCQSNRGQFSLANGATPLMEEVGAWGASQASSALSENAWHCVEMYMASPSASTPMQYWIDGISTGTVNGSFATSSAYDHIEFGNASLGGGTNVSGTYYLDELVVSNSYVGTGITSPVTYFSDNFESWSVHGGTWSSVNGETSTHTLNTSTDYARSGTKSLKLTDTDTTATTGAYLSKSFSPAISGDAYVRFYIYLPTGYGSSSSNCNRRLLRICSGSNKALLVADADAVYVQETVGWTGTSQIAISEAQWHCIEMHVTPPAAVTVIEFWVDGVYQSQLTANFSAASTWTPIDFGDTSIGSGSNGTGTFYLDEFIVSNAYNGPLP